RRRRRRRRRRRPPRRRPAACRRAGCRSGTKARRRPRAGAPGPPSVACGDHLVTTKRTTRGVVTPLNGRRTHFMRYVLVPEPIIIRDPVTDEVKGESGNRATTFAKSVRIALLSVAAKGQTDAATMFDIRSKFDEAEVGRWIELTEDEWKLLEPEFRR